MQIKELKDVVQDGLHILEKKPGVKQAEIFASANELIIMRIGFSTNIPNNALEEPKSVDSYGLSVRVLSDDGKIGFGKVDSELTSNAVHVAFENAKKNAVRDTDFVSLPEPGEKPTISDYHDPKLLQVNDEFAIDLGYTCLQGALDTLSGKKYERAANITGEINFLKEQIAIANTNGINEYDETTVALGTLTTILELEKDISGMWFDSSTHLHSFDPYKAGQISAEKALASVNPVSLSTGSYKVILGRQAIADLFSHNFSPDLGSVDIHAVPFKMSDLDTQYSSEQLTVYDNAIAPDLIGTKRITDEGLATRQTTLVEEGKLVNFLSNDYYSKKYAGKDTRFVPGNGFRFGGGGRNYDSQPGVSATNLTVQAGSFGDEELIREVKDGVYVGRIWYTYPVNGGTSSDFSSTIRGDSYHIKDGQLEKGLTPNTVRINDNIKTLLKNIVGMSKQTKASLVWGAEEVVVCPEIAFENMKLHRIAEGLY
jgi:PmbA protein